MTYPSQSREYHRAYYLKNKEKANERCREYRKRNLERVREMDRNYRQANPAKALWQAAKQRSAKRGIPFDIDISDIVVPERCPILDVPFQYGTEYAHSLDRKDNSKGYVKGNVWVISKKANSMKSNATPDELRAFAQWVVFSG